MRVFEAEAARAIASYSGGVPRLVNVLAHKCLMLAYGENEHRVNVRHVDLAAADTPGVQQPQPWWKSWWTFLTGKFAKKSRPRRSVDSQTSQDKRSGGLL